ncbi:hypothetical protein [Oceanicola sp. 22II-s10i]|uniref:hypothetical protein n=1 Tax=Oceanicola sp. 22II-s10i TaxID=1317116 RepID=UPI00113033C4|nr:hypothetical protein [Oceanicola sp. 22II-s10i]
MAALIAPETGQGTNMRSFQSPEDVANFMETDQAGVIALYLDDGLDAEKLRAIHEAKAHFDPLVGTAWHLLMPRKNGDLTPDFAPDPDQYNSALSREMADELGVHAERMPVLVFPDPDQKHSALVIELGALSREELIAEIRAIAHVVTRPQEPHQDILSFRRQVVSEIKAREQGKKLASVVPVVAQGLAGFAKIFF